MQIHEVVAQHPDIQKLIAIHRAFCDAVSPETACFAVTTDSPELDRFRYWLAMGNEKAIGCIGLNCLDDTHGEVKTMHVLQEARGTGAGDALIEHLVAQARRSGLARLSLETGTSEDFAPSRRLYERHGFEACAPLAEYKEHPFSHFMTLAL
ncbi:MAG: GNAT family N-acetyltransferase [Pseudomonadota bacterium]